MKTTPLTRVKPLGCDCPTAFFYSTLPCLNEPHNYIGGSTQTFKFGDAVYNKTNSGIFALDIDGSLLIKIPGTYFATMKVAISFSGDTTGAFVGGYVVVESPDQTQGTQMLVISEPLTAEYSISGNAIFNANAVIHVGDPLYGVSTPTARVYLWLSMDGTVEYTPNIEFTVRN